MEVEGPVGSSADDQLAKKLVRYALSCEYSRTAIRRDGIKERGTIEAQGGPRPHTNSEYSFGEPKPILQAHIRSGAETAPSSLGNGTTRASGTRKDVTARETSRYMMFICDMLVLILMLP
jgi:hypothetical protein